MAVVLQEIGAHARRLLPVLDQLDAKAWTAKGASDTYIEQLDSSKAQTRALADEAAALIRNPEKLSAELQLFFRVQGLETVIASLQEAAASTSRRRWPSRWPRSSAKAAPIASACALTSSIWRRSARTSSKSWTARRNAAAPRSWPPRRPPRLQEGRSKPHAVHLQHLWRGIHPNLRPLHQGRLRQPS